MILKFQDESRVGYFGRDQNTSKTENRYFCPSSQLRDVRLASLLKVEQ